MARKKLKWGPGEAYNQELKNNGSSLFHWFMNQSGTINGFTKTIWSGVTTIELAKSVEWAIDKKIAGIYHLTNNQKISKYKLLTLFKKFTKKDIEILPVEGQDLDKSFIDTRRLIDYTVPSYDQMIFNMIELINKDRSLYSQYQIGNTVAK